MSSSSVLEVVQKPFKNDPQRVPWWHLNHIPRTSTKLCENVLYIPQTKSPYFLNAPNARKQFNNDLKVAANGQFHAAYRGREPARTFTLFVTPKSFLFLLNRSINSVSKAIALFILQPVLGIKVVKRIYWFHLSVCSPSDSWTARLHNKKWVCCII